MIGNGFYDFINISYMSLVNVSLLMGVMEEFRGEILCVDEVVYVRT